MKQPNYEDCFSTDDTTHGLHQLYEDGYVDSPSKSLCDRTARSKSDIDTIRMRLFVAAIIAQAMDDFRALYKLGYINKDFKRCGCIPNWVISRYDSPTQLKRFFYSTYFTGLCSFIRISPEVIIRGLTISVKENIVELLSRKLHDTY